MSVHKLYIQFVLKPLNHVRKVKSLEQDCFLLISEYDYQKMNSNEKNIWKPGSLYYIIIFLL